MLFAGVYTHHTEEASDEYARKAVRSPARSELLIGQYRALGEQQRRVNPAQAFQYDSNHGISRDPTKSV